MIRFFAGLAALLISICANAQQPQVGVPPALEVQRLAPQLVPFFGSQANFQNLVNGLVLGQPVSLTTTGADGVTRLVTFTPAGVPLPPLQIAQTLETARTQLISRGIATPSGEQVAVVLNGGTLPTTLGGVQVSGLLQPQTPAVPSAAAGGSQPSPAAQMQQQVLPNSAASNSSSTTPGTATTSTSPFGRGISDSVVPNSSVVAPPAIQTPAPVTSAPPPVAPVPPAPTPTPRPGVAPAPAIGAR